MQKGADRASISFYNNGFFIAQLEQFFTCIPIEIFSESLKNISVWNDAMAAREKAPKKINFACMYPLHFRFAEIIPDTKRNRHNLNDLFNIISIKAHFTSNRCPL
jgi:hypothetical protein